MLIQVSEKTKKIFSAIAPRRFTKRAGMLEQQGLNAGTGTDSLSTGNKFVSKYQNSVNVSSKTL